ncbi:MAG: IMP dehydrogenase [Verrucomicrobia bacterium]|nr:IMP dehydrogenase [Verrucomicrobiota bacterium]
MANNDHLNTFMTSFPHEALTFDDVSLVTQFADFLPGDADVSSRLSRNVGLNIPFVSAAMDTVTETNMAIAVAMLGGIGVVHKNLSAEEQASIIGTVKHHLHGLIADPKTFSVDATLDDVYAKRKSKGYSFSGFPILDTDGKIVGILTSRDIKFSDNPHAPVSEVMTKEVITAPKNTNLQQAYDLMRKNKIGKLPIVENGALVGLYSYADVRTLMENEEPLYNRDAHYRLRVAAAVGPSDEARVEALADQGVDAIVVDTAHGHTRGVLEMTTWVKNHYPEIDVVAGNIATAEAALALRHAGADGVKVGIGPGSICTTRVVAGVGVPQISAIYDVAQALEGSIPVIADGGIRHSGDVVKAIVAGADSVMMGSVLAGTEESPGEKIIYQGRQYVVYRGMGSLDAMKAREGSRERYGLAGASEDELVPQGIEGMVPYAGNVGKVLKQYSGGLQAGMGYSGCRTINDLQEKGKFVRITGAGISEAHPHDVQITKDAPNYRQRG